MAHLAHLLSILASSSNWLASDITHRSISDLTASVAQAWRLVFGVFMARSFVRRQPVSQAVI